MEIRRRLANLYTGLEASFITQQEPTPFRDELRRKMPHATQNAIRESCNDQWTFIKNFYFLELPEICDISLDKDLVEKSVAALLAYADMEKDLAQHIAILDSKLSSLRAHDRPILEMIDVLKGQ